MASRRGFGTKRNVRNPKPSRRPILQVYRLAQGEDLRRATPHRTGNLPVGGVGEKGGLVRNKRGGGDVLDIAAEYPLQRPADRIAPKHLAHRKKQVGPSRQAEQGGMLKFPAVGLTVVERQQPVIAVLCRRANRKLPL